MQVEGDIEGLPDGNRVGQLGGLVVTVNGTGDLDIGNDGGRGWNDRRAGGAGWWQGMQPSGYQQDTHTAQHQDQSDNSDDQRDEASFPLALRWRGSK